jgi:hypothetical protein
VLSYRLLGTHALLKVTRRNTMASSPMWRSNDGEQSEPRRPAESKSKSEARPTQFFNSLLEFLPGSPMVFAADRAFNDLLRNYGKRAVVDNLRLIEAWSLGVTDRQDDQSAPQAALDFVRSREGDRVADYRRNARRGEPSWNPRAF